MHFKTFSCDIKVDSSIIQTTNYSCLDCNKLKAGHEKPHNIVTKLLSTNLLTAADKPDCESSNNIWSSFYSKLNVLKFPLLLGGSMADLVNGLFCGFRVSGLESWNRKF
jgi:hypothetical protein